MARYRADVILETEYVLVMNSIFGQAEQKQIVYRAPTRELVKSFYDSEKVESYTEELPYFDGFSRDTRQMRQYSKQFRKGGPLEDFNALWDSEFITPGIFSHGIHELPLQIIEVITKTPID